MTTLTKNKEYLVTWLGEFPKWNYKMQTPVLARCLSESLSWEYIQEHVDAGWVVLEVSIEEAN
jgi:hypothetical protein